MQLSDLPSAVWLLSAILLGIVFLAVLYPDRLVFTGPNTADLPLGGMRNHPLIGHTLDVIREGGKRGHHGLLQWQQYAGPRGDRKSWPKTGTFVTVGRLYMINRPEYLTYVQKDNFLNYPKGDMFRRFLADLLGVNGIFTSDGDIWKAQRKLASHVFSVSNFKNHVQQVLHEELDVVNDLFTNLAKRGETVNLQDIFFRFTLASFGRLAFNQDFGCLTTKPENLNVEVPFAAAFDFAQSQIDLRVFNPAWEITELFTPSGAKMRRARKLVRGYAADVIDNRLALRKTGAGAAGAAKQGMDAAKGGRDLLDLFVDQGLDREALIETVLNLLIAGRDTTAQALSWQFWELSRRPDVVAKAREEAQRVLGGRSPTYEDLPELVYLNAIFHETLRLHPSVPKNMKEVAADDVLPAIPSEGIPPIPVRKGERVIWSDWVMARMPEIWGEDCAEFKPERWIDEDGRLQKFSQFKFHAFNAGPRLCLGQTLATFEGVGLTAFVLTRFDVHLKPGQDEPRYANSLTLPMKDPLEVEITVR